MSTWRLNARSTNSSRGREAVQIARSVNVRHGSVTKKPAWRIGDGGRAA
ncbi:MAG: hypothetical protein M3063_08565 [Actinomycetota bacterium]|nr:hypothetical protein [Actinomycetota bacterium]